jgi:hypothetical protein
MVGTKQWHKAVELYLQDTAAAAAAAVVGWSGISLCRIACSLFLSSLHAVLCLGLAAGVPQRRLEAHSLRQLLLEAPCRHQQQPGSSP